MKHEASLDREANLEPEDEKMAELRALLLNADTGAENSRARVRERLMRKLEKQILNDEEKGAIIMRKRSKKPVIAAAAALCLIATATTAYATGFAQTVLESFKVGNIAVERVDQLPDSSQTAPREETAAGRPDVSAPRNFAALADAQAAAGVDFPAPSAVPGYAATGYSLHNSLLEAQYAHESESGRIYSLLISNSENKIQTADDIRAVTVADTAVYFANGIILWEYGGFTYELYQMGGEDFDVDIIAMLIESLR
ncbi:MAG: hypothetical protein LBH21_04955 [Gracilibacteraceae bacterium]|jgi:hypothetical protein|nr:hypothetical protein [Gracilibacteraceae bacterium]